MLLDLTLANPENRIEQLVVGRDGALGWWLELGVALEDLVQAGAAQGAPAAESLGVLTLLDTRFT